MLMDQPRIAKMLLRSPKLLSLRFRLPELGIRAIIFNYRKHAGVQVVE